MSDFPGLFGPPSRDPDEQRDIDENPGVLQEAGTDRGETRNDTALRAAEMPVHDRTAEHAAARAASPDSSAADAERVREAADGDGPGESEREDSDATGSHPPQPGLPR